MKAKKLLTSLLAVAMMASLAACGGGKTAETNPPSGSQDPVKQEVTWPGKNLTIWVPNKAGSNNDLTARVLATYIQKTYGTNVTVMNNGDGGGVTAYEEVRNAKPDGSTLLWQHAGMVIGYWTGGYDYEATPENFTVLGMIARGGPTAYCAQANAPYNNLDELVAYLKDHPDEVRMGVKIGNSTHLTACQLQNALGVTFKMVDGADNASRLAALLGDNMDLGSLDVKTAEQYVETGDLKIIFTSSPYSDKYQNCTDWNNGQLDFMGAAGTMLWGPAGMDEELIEKIGSVLEACSKDTESADNLTSMGQIPDYQGHAALTEYVANENVAKKEATTAAGINVRG